MIRMVTRAVVATLGATVLAGCASVTEQQAGDAATRFIAAQPTQACQLLAPGTLETLEESHGAPCAATLGGLGLGTARQVTRVAVAGDSAQVVLADQVVFLARFTQGWLVTAAGCTRDDPDRNVPYKCKVKP